MLKKAIIITYYVYCRYRVGAPYSHLVRFGRARPEKGALRSRAESARLAVSSARKRANCVDCTQPGGKGAERRQRRRLGEDRRKYFLRVFDDIERALSSIEMRTGLELAARFERATESPGRPSSRSGPGTRLVGKSVRQFTSGQARVACAAGGGAALRSRST